MGVAVALAVSLQSSAEAQAHSRAASPASSGAVSTVDSEARTVTAVSPSRVTQYWTPARMAAATPEDTRKSLPAGRRPVTAGGTASTPATVSSAPPRFPSSVARGSTSVAQVSTAMRTAYFNGRPSIGIVFYKGKDMRAHYCTAFLVTSASKNLIMMAAHCDPGSWMAFVAGYRINGKTTAPWGVWPVLKAYTDARFRSTGAGTDYDYAFAKVGRNAAGRQIQDIIHGNTLAVTPTYRNAWAAVTGYPKAGSAPANRPVTCWAPTRKLAGYTQMVFLCRGFYGGTSGSPWLIGFNPRTNTGKAIGLIGGYEAGGPNSWTSYSPIFTRNTMTLYRYAVAH
jgi:V8-like Glu-specific endopeptidase